MKALIIIILSLSALRAQDVIFLRNGETRSGRITAADREQFRLQVPLPPRPGTQPAFATVAVPKSQVSSIEWAPDPALEEALRSAAPAQLQKIAALWSAQTLWLDVPKSPAARIGCRYGHLLLQSGAAEKAFEIFQLIESQAWCDADRTAAKQGRLRAMIASGRARDTVAEAEQLAASSEDPLVLIEAKFLLAETAAASLKKLLEDNPRWQEDTNVVPERDRLYHEAMDLYLYPSLFQGSVTEAAARGLWGAIGACQLAGEPGNIFEYATDITVLYPATEYASRANALIASLPKTQPADNLDVAEAPAPRSPAPKPEKPKKKSHENKKPKKA